MKKTLSSLCRWVLKIGGKKIDLGHGSDEELDRALLQLLADGKLDNFDVENAIFYAKTPEEEIEEKIAQIQSDLKGSAITRTQTIERIDAGGNTVEEVEPYLAIPHYRGVTYIIHNVDIDGEPLVKDMNLDDFKNKRKLDYQDSEKMKTLTAPSGKLISEFQNTDPTKLIDQEVQSWEQLTEMGTEIHEVFEKIFKDEEPMRRASDSLVTEEVFKQLVNDVKTFKRTLQAKFGKNCKFYPEMGITAKNLSPEMTMKLQQNGIEGISGVIDLLVVDEKNNAHIIDYKVSRKLVGAWNGYDTLDKKWDWDKKQSATYQVELYRQMLKQYGFNSVDTYIVPIKTDLSYNDDNNPFKVTALNGVRFSTNFSTSEDGETPVIYNPGRKGNKNYVATISNNFFAPMHITSSSDVVAISKAYDTFIPKSGAISRLEDKKSDIEWYRRQERYVRELKPGEYKYAKGKRFTVKLPGYKSGSTQYFETEEQVTAALKDYIEKKSTIQADKYLTYATTIQEIKDGVKEVDDLMSLVSKEGGPAVVAHLSRYLRNDWAFIPDEGANSIGIYMFVKHNKCEIVCLTDLCLGKNMSDYGIKNSVGLWKGTSILGKTVADKNIDSRQVLPALAENVEAMKVMSFISLHPEMFEKTRIAEIKVINPDLGLIDSKSNSSLIYNFNKLVAENVNCGVSRVKTNIFLDDKVAAVEGAKEWYPDIKTDFTKPDSDGNYYTEKWFLQKMNEFQTTYRYEFNPNRYENTEVGNAYARLRQGLLACRGYENWKEQDKQDITTGKFFELNGLMVASPQFSSSSNVRMLSQCIDEYAKEVRKQVFELGLPMALAFDELYKQKGTGEKAFRNWFVNSDFKDPENKLTLKDPNSPEFDGSPVERKCLDLFLTTLAKLRNPGKKLEEIPKDAHYYELPLLEARSSRQLKRLKFTDVVKNKWKQYKTLTEGLFMGEEQYDFVKGSQTVYNKFDVTDIERVERLRKYTPGMFETDLELVINEALVAYKRSQVSETYIPLIAAMKTNLEYIDEHSSSLHTRDMANIKKTFDKLIQSKVYGESIVDEKLQPILKFLNVIKSGFTVMTLGLNVRSFLRESLQGIWAGVSRAGVKLYPGINEKSYIEGLTQVIQDSGKNFSGVSMLQQMNQVYGMANMSLAQLAGQRRVKWAHLNHVGKDTLFITATAPDFMHRMGLLVAKMKNDGCWEAHSLDKNGQLVYDFKKDKRFEHFINGETSHKDYTKEQSLYLTMIQDFNEAGFTNSDGSRLDGSKTDALPQAYTRQEGQSIKNYADLLYGHYDDESRSLLCDTFFGAFFLQYKTYLTAKLEQWTMHEGKYNIAELKQQFDDQGNEMYVRYYFDEENLPHKDILLKNEYNELTEEEKSQCRLYYDYEGLPMQGMVQEMGNFIKNLFTWNTEDIQRMWDDPTSRAMLQLAFHDLFLMGLMGLLVTFIFGTALDVENPANAREVVKALKSAGPVENFTYNVLAGSVADFSLPNILSNFTNKPAMLTSAQRLASSSLNLITGDSNVAYWLTQNFGVIKDFQGATKHLTDF